MKRFLFLFVFIAAMLGCSKSNDEDSAQLNLSAPNGMGVSVSADGDISISAPAEGFSTTLKLNATKAWSANVNETRGGVVTKQANLSSDVAHSWCMISPSKGDAGNVEVDIVLEANNSSAERHATVVITCGDVKKTVSVTQAGEGTPTVGVKIVSHSPGPDFLTHTVEITNNGDEVIKAEFGLRYSLDETMANAKTVSGVSKEIKPGESDTVSIKISDLKSDIYYYIQGVATLDGKEYVGEVESAQTKPAYIRFHEDTKESYDFGEDGGSFSSVVYANVPFEVSFSGDWLTVAIEEHAYDNTFHQYMFNVLPNTSENNRIATVSFESKKYGIKIMVTVNQTKKMPDFGETSGHAWVNLGLPSGTLWAKMNIGAEKVEDCGRYMSWGESVVVGEKDPDNLYNFKSYETFVKQNYSTYSYKFYYDKAFEEGDNAMGLPTSGLVNKYCRADGKLVLEDMDDAARVIWGENWTMPTYEQVAELVQNTYYEWTTNYNGSNVAGGVFYRKKNGADAKYDLDDTHIFIPAGGEAEWKINYVGSFGRIYSKSLVPPRASINPDYYVSGLGFSERSADVVSLARWLGYNFRAVVVK
ncbi:MAG: BACON domain-containing protein [Bacteroidales bacterium]|nr:BACON domain-containing protein [Candidatus Physcocola equi]